MNFPYVATEDGFRRKIGPASRYSMNDKTSAYSDGIGPQGAQSSMNARQRVGSDMQTVGTPHRSMESDTPRRLQEARERAEAQAYSDRQATARALAAEVEEQTRKGKAAEEKSKADERAAKEAEAKKKEENPVRGIQRRVRQAARRFSKPPATLPPAILA